MKYCTKCGAEMPDDSKFCTKCGSQLSEKSVRQPVKGKKPMLLGVGAVLAVAVVALVIVLSKGKGSGNSDEVLTYVILEEHEIPQEFLSIIEEKKMYEFKLTYTDEESLYIAVGYGEQQTGGYSISVNQCYRSQNAIYFDTTLVKPSTDDQIHQADLCPYLVIKTEYLEKNVVFE